MTLLAGKLSPGPNISFFDDGPVMEDTGSTRAFNRLRAAVFRHTTTISGFVFDPELENTCFAVELLLNGWHAQLHRADLYSHPLATMGVLNAFHGFLFCLPEGLCLAEATAQVRIANTDLVLDQFKLDSASDGAPHEMVGPGEIKWYGGLRFGGWLTPRVDIPASLRGFIDEVAVIDIIAGGWALPEHGPTGRPAPAFDFHLPLHFADGHVRRLHVVNASGESLRGSPLPFVAYPDGLERFLENHAEAAPHALRGRWAEALMPQSLPFDWVDVWRKRFPYPPVADVSTPIAVILMGAFDVEASLKSLDQCQGDWIAAHITFVGGEGLFIKDQLLEFLSAEAASCEHVVFLRAGGRLEKEALQMLAQALEHYPNATFAYADVVVVDARSTRHPLALPVFDYERLIEQGYPVYLFALRRRELMTALSMIQGNLFDLLLNSCVDEDLPDKPVAVHVPGFLAECPVFDVDELNVALLEATRDHFKSKGSVTRVEAANGWILPSVHVSRMVARQRVSVLVSSRYHIKSLRMCLESLWAQQTRHELELILLNCISPKADGLDYLNDIEGRALKTIDFNSTASSIAMLHDGAAAASGDYLFFLDQHIELSDMNTIDELMSRQFRPGVGAVGLCVTWPGGTVREAGAILGPNFSCVPSGAGFAAHAYGFADMLASARECSALSGLPFLTRKDQYLEAGGLDHKTFPHVFAIPDYCLRQNRIGHRTLITPRVRAIAHNSENKDRLTSAEADANFTRELAAFRQRWGDDLMCDPYYNPCLSLDTAFSALAWPPRNMEARWRNEHG